MIEGIEDATLLPDYGTMALSMLDQGAPLASVSLPNAVGPVQVFDGEGLAGFEYHGPQRRLGFAPRLTPKWFRSVFTTADAWGTYDQRREGDRQTHVIDVKWGQLHLRHLALAVPAGSQPKTAVLKLMGSEVSGKISYQDSTAFFDFSDEQVVTAGQQLTVEFVI